MEGRCFFVKNRKKSEHVKKTNKFYSLDGTARLCILVGAFSFCQKVRQLVRIMSQWSKEISFNYNSKTGLVKSSLHWWHLYLLLVVEELLDVLHHSCGLLGIEEGRTASLTLVRTVDSVENEREAFGWKTLPMEHWVNHSGITFDE